VGRAQGGGRRGEEQQERHKAAVHPPAGEPSQLILHSADEQKLPIKASSKPQHNTPNLLEIGTHPVPEA